MHRLLVAGDYIQHSHHWAWSQAFTAAVSGPNSQALAAAACSAPQLPDPAEAVRTWACLAACWTACQLQQQQHATAVAAAAAQASAVDTAGATSMGLEVHSEEIEAVLAQLGTSPRTASEADSAKVQLIASSALGMVCMAVHEAAQQLQQPAAASDALGSRCSSLQQHLTALQTVLLQYQQAGLSFVVDLSSSMASDELPEAATTLEDLLEQHNAAGSDEVQLQQALPEQQQGSQQHAWVAEAAGKLQLLQQLLAAIKYEAVAPLAPWAAAAAVGSAESGEVDHIAHTSDQDAVAATAAAAGGGIVMLQAGPVSQLQCWAAAKALVAATWQQLHLLLQQSLQLGQQMQALAALAAAGGAAGIPATDSALLLQVEQLQQLLLPQGYDVAYAEDCVAAVQLLQVQWSELDEAFVRCLGACLCPLLGLSHLGLEQWQNAADSATSAAGLEPGAADGTRPKFMLVDDQAVSVLQQVLAAASAGIAGGAAMHSKDVFDALAGSGAAAAAAPGLGGSDGSSSSSSMWGTPEPAAACKSLVALLLQCGCLQQQVQQQLGTAAKSLADDSAVGIDVLGSSTALPLDLEQYRPLVFVVQVLHSLLQAPADCGRNAVDQTAAAAGPGLCERLEQVLVPAVSGCLLPQLQQQLGRLQQHLQLLGSEAAGVLQRLRHGGTGSGTAAGITSASQPQAHMDEPLAAGGSSQGPGLGGEAADDAAWDAPDLVPFSAFDTSLPGAGMMLEDGDDELGGALEDDADLQAALESEDDAPLQQQGGMQGVLDDDGGNDEGLDWLLQEQQAQQDAASSQQQHVMTAAAAAGSEGLSGMPDLVPFDAFDPLLPGAGAVLEGGGLELGGALEDDNSLKGHSNSLEPAGKQSTAAAEDAALTLSDSAEWQKLGQQLLSHGLLRAQQLQHQQQLAGLQQAGPSCDWQQQVWLRHLAAFEWLWGDLLQLQLEQIGQSELTQHLQTLVEAAAVSLGMPVGDSSSADTTSEGAAAVTAAAVAAAAAAALKPGDAFQWYFSQLGLLQLLPRHPDQASDSSCASLPLSHLLGTSGQSEGTSSAAAHSSSSAELRMPGRAELIGAWQEVSESLADLEAGVTAWQQASAAAAGGVKEAVARLAVQGGVLVGDPAVCFKVRDRISLCAAAVFYILLQRRVESWLETLPCVSR
jgi:hypothetical protein